MKIRLKKSARIAALAAVFMMPTAVLTSSPALAAPENYVIDTQGAHAFIQFRIKHLGFSWLWGRFDTFNGEFTVDKDNIANASVSVDIDIASINSNHAERDKHLRGADFFDVAKFPTARFVSTKVEQTGDMTADIHGNLTLKGITKPVIIKAVYVGSGDDPWGGYRAGFEGTTEITLKDFGIDYDLGPAAQTAQLQLSVEGIRK